MDRAVGRILDAVQRNTHQILPRIRQLRRQDQGLGGERFLPGFVRLTTASTLRVTSPTFASATTSNVSEWKLGGGWIVLALVISTTISSGSPSGSCERTV